MNPLMKTSYRNGAAVAKIYANLKIPAGGGKKAKRRPLPDGERTAFNGMLLRSGQGLAGGLSD
jgi:hypothetical protein